MDDAAAIVRMHPIETSAIDDADRFGNGMRLAVDENVQVRVDVKVPILLPLALDSGDRLAVGGAVGRRNFIGRTDDDQRRRNARNCPDLHRSTLVFFVSTFFTIAPSTFLLMSEGATILPSTHERQDFVPDQER